MLAAPMVLILVVFAAAENLLLRGSAISVARYPLPTQWGEGHFVADGIG